MPLAVQTSNDYSVIAGKKISTDDKIKRQQSGERLPGRHAVDASLLAGSIAQLYRWEIGSTPEVSKNFCLPGNP